MVVVILLPLYLNSNVSRVLARPALDVVDKLANVPQRLFTGTRLKHKPHVNVVRHHDKRGGPDMSAWPLVFKKYRLAGRQSGRRQFDLVAFDPAKQRQPPLDGKRDENRRAAAIVIAVKTPIALDHFVCRLHFVTRPRAAFHVVFTSALAPSSCCVFQILHSPPSTT